jgi:cohesin loading factor subunit SCC2
MSGLESTTKAAKAIVLFLTQRSGKAKATKNSNEAEYRAIFDNLVSDLLIVLFWPEWPAASLLLGIICKFMVSVTSTLVLEAPEYLICAVSCQVSSLDDVKSSNQTDNNAAKTMALDHLGVIAARIRSSMLRSKQDADDGFVGLKTLDEVLSSSLGSVSRSYLVRRSCLARALDISSDWQPHTKIWQRIWQSGRPKTRLMK